MAQAFNSGLKDVAWHYLKCLGVKVTQTTAKSDIEESPHYPSLLSLSDSFSKYKIDGDAYEVKKEYVDELQPPFVAFFNIPEVGKDFVLVTAIDKNKVDFLYKGPKRQTLPKEEFFTRFEHIIWQAEPGGQSGETGYAEALKKEKALQQKRAATYAGIIALFLIAFTVNIPPAHPLAFSGIALLKSAGLAATIMLLMVETNNNNTFVNNLCSAGGHANCEAVLHSKAAKLKGVSWAEIGFYYFATTLLLLLVPDVPFASKSLLLAGASALAMPYILFSLFYQWRVIKQWCLLCLLVQAVLFSEGIWAAVNLLGQPRAAWAATQPVFLLEIVFCLLFPVVTWNVIKSLLLRSKDAATYKIAYKRLQYNPELFNGLLQQQAKAPDGWQQLGISIGNPNARTSIVKVCNPYCGPCARAHPQLEEIVTSRDDVHLKIIFTAKNDDRDRASFIVRHLLAIAALGDPAIAIQSLSDWYLADKKVYNHFAAKYPMNGELEEQRTKLDAMSKWCEKAEITHTPTIFINGYRMPEGYRIEELKHIL
jgi:uncharacterized membrane protein/thiol-disulfide isomerase/thioredoxin